jgi:hypothetical protein
MNYGNYQIPIKENKTNKNIVNDYLRDLKRIKDNFI